MQPIRLEMIAFGPFAQRQEVVFDALRDHGLYLISGPTGAGKSTLLDAMTFALYGESSGRERSGEELRSDHAAPEDETRVAFDFLLAERAYRVTRTPRWDRPKQRGEGMTTVASNAALHRLEQTAEGWAEGECVAVGLRDVNETIEHLLGFSAAQFRQVILLPQGRFRALLSASTDEREKILGRLFDTAEHAALQRRLRELAKGLEREAEQGRERRLGLLEAVEAGSVEALAERIAARDAELATLAVAASAARVAEERARGARDSAHDRNEQLDRLASARARIEALGAQAPAIEEDRVALSQIELALGLADLAEAVTKAQEREERSGADLELATEARQEARTGLAAAAEALAQAERSAPERAALADRVRECEALEDRVARWQAAASALAETEGHLAGARQARDQLAASIAANETAGRALETRIGALRQAAAGVEAARLRGADASRALAEFERTVVAAQALARVRENLATARTAHAAANAERDSAVALLDRTRDAFVASQAHLLAEALTPGEACPVCGSTEHPAPAESTDAVRREDVDAAAAALAAQEETVTPLGLQLAELDRQLAEAQAGVPADFDPRGGEALRAAVVATGHRLAAAEAAAAELEQCIEDRSALAADLDTSRAALAHAQAALAEATSAESRARATRDERETGLPADLRDAAAVAAALGQARESLARAEAAHARSAQRAAEARERDAQAAAVLAAADAHHRQAQEARRQEGHALAERLAAVGFDSIETLGGWLSRRDDAQALANGIAAHDDALKAARGVVASLEQDVGDARAVDLAPLEEALVAASTARSGADSALVRETAAQDRDRGAQAKLDDLGRSLADLDAEFAVLASLAEVANDRSMTFQRHVLAVLLDRVLLLASDHLEHMSRGRYQLLRGLEARDARSHGGLDLEVEDAYTGKRRSVRTLSGGEGFMTALALALGLSETVQNLAGGIRLDALFIDEGFGSLDEEALDLAIDTLVGLRGAGRLVGVISHVPEMRQRLAARIEVSKRQEGSTVRLVLP